VVKLAERKADGVVVVVKQINLSCMSPKEIADAQREVSILSQFDHANIIKYLDCVVDEVNPTPRYPFLRTPCKQRQQQQHQLTIVAASPPTLTHTRMVDSCTLASPLQRSGVVKRRGMPWATHRAHSYAASSVK
jgi:serine/threonine protein kinase